MFDSHVAEWSGRCTTINVSVGHGDVGVSEAWQAIWDLPVKYMSSRR